MSFVATGGIEGAMALGKGVSGWLGNIAGRTKNIGEKRLYDFSTTAAQHMTESGRKVPIQIMDDVLKTTKGISDPRGSKVLMHYSPMWKNGKLYNLEILYDKTSNSIWHFKYTQDALGPLPLIK